MRCCLDLEALQVKAHIGVEAAERAVLQDLEISFSVQFAQAPLGCVSDKIEDTCCYGAICDTLVAICKNQEFKLIEALTHTLAEALQAKLPSDACFELRVKKVSPPVHGLRGGATFRMML